MQVYPGISVAYSTSAVAIKKYDANLTRSDFVTENYRRGGNRGFQLSVEVCKGIRGSKRTFRLINKLVFILHNLKAGPIGYL